MIDSVTLTNPKKTIQAIIDSLENQRNKFVEIALHDACDESQRDSIKRSIDSIDNSLKHLQTLLDGLNKKPDHKSG
jgi:hypothetical protein